MSESCVYFENEFNPGKAEYGYVIPLGFLSIKHVLLSYAFPYTFAFVNAYNFLLHTSSIMVQGSLTRVHTKTVRERFRKRKQL